MITNSAAAQGTYDETQMGYIRLQSALNLLDYLSGLYYDELPESTTGAPTAVRKLTTALERELRAYVVGIAPQLLCPERKTKRGLNYLRPRQPFTGGRPQKSGAEADRAPAAGGAGGS